jgi:hypothetical protein
LVSAIDAAFHTTYHNDQTIADNIAGQGITTTRNQVEEVRLAHGWRRRGGNDGQLAISRAETFSSVEEALQQGMRCYGRGLLRAFLRVKYRHQAREDDVRDALAQLDPAGRGPTKDTKAESLLHPDLIGYGAAMDMTNSATSALRYTYASMHIQDESSDAMSAIAIVGRLAYFAR